MLNFALYIDNHNVTRFELNGRVDVSGSLLSHLLSLLFFYMYIQERTEDSSSQEGSSQKSMSLWIGVIIRYLNPMK